MKHRRYSIYALRLYWHRHGCFPPDAHPQEVESLRRQFGVEAGRLKSVSDCMTPHAPPLLSYSKVARQGKVPIRSTQNR